MNVELRQLRYFIAVAEELHFTRAAGRLSMTQQPLSAAIADLEARLGVRLLHRSTRRVELTDAGAAFLVAARRAVRAGEAAVEIARAHGAGQAGMLRVGLSPGARYATQEALAGFAATHPRVRLRTREESSAGLVDDVAAGTLDLAVGFCALPHPHLRYQRLADEPVVVAVAASHQLAGRTRTTLEELRRHVFALDDPAEGPGYDAAVLALCRGAGFQPRTCELTGPGAWEAGVLRHGHIGLTTASATQAAHRDIRVLALTPPASFPLDLICRPLTEETPPVLQALAAYLTMRFPTEQTRR